jgi:hypothetical protein
MKAGKHKGSDYRHDSFISKMSVPALAARLRWCGMRILGRKDVYLLTMGIKTTFTKKWIAINSNKEMILIIALRFDASTA